MSPAGPRRRDRPPPRTGPGEKAVLTGFLDYLRGSVLAKVDGVPEHDLRTPRVPSGTNLLGLVEHLAHVERFVFLGERASDWQATFHAAPDASPRDVVRGYREAVAAADRAIAACQDLDLPAHAGGPGGPAPSMRWALVHMIEETGRHAGHLDILRELADGATGR
ncbi:DinB family protein [Nocardiopsis sp. NPDC006139]|uniref:DinB family protein n=1 Tax=Nocardiopsis TaxID=2013 RepID=UPI0033B748DD